MFWLTPVSIADPLVFAAERKAVYPGDDWTEFRDRLQRIHPRLLMLFKAELLLDEGDDEGCGVAAATSTSLSEPEQQRLRLDVAESIHFDGSVFSLSHCAVAFFDRILSSAECIRLVDRFVEINQDGGQYTNLSEQQEEWVRWLLRMWNDGYAVIVLREDGTGH